MRTRQKGRGTPEPTEPWNEVVPGLWMGGHHWTDSLGVRHPAVADREFDLVVSLWTRPGHGPAPGVEHLVAELPDGPLDARQIGAVQALARTVVDALGRGRTVLVRCHSGHNRSGLVVAQALVELGRSASEAVAAVRDRRSPHALGTPVFEDYLRTGLDVARLLTGLDAPA
ncbi:protein phosphatase [Streptomyces sp. NPDC004311]|uniref:protein-tyrosine phosphatase family protein n=1 Tax=Streptomyces sp. NPDC004311 TaxID=3364698 RepID=UPI00369C07D5